MVAIDPVRSFLDIKDLHDKGYEVVVSVVNEGEDWLYVRGAQVDVAKNGKAFGRHTVSFPGGGAKPIRLGQFESVEGHFHLAPDTLVKDITCTVRLDYTYGERRDTRTIARKLETQRVARA